MLDVLLRHLTPTSPPAPAAPDLAPAEHSARPAPPLMLAPSYEPGVCYHDGHLELDGERYGVLRLAGSEHLATLLRCHHHAPGERPATVAP